MNARIVRPDPASESPTEERCFVLESWNHESDPAVSIARARVAPGVTTQLHSVDVDERYVIVAGGGEVEVGDLPPTEVALGDVVVIIPVGAPRRITNNRDEDPSSTAYARPARTLMTTSQCCLGVVRHVESGANRTGKVVRERPPAGTTLDAQTKIDLWLGKR